MEGIYERKPNNVANESSFIVQAKEKTTCTSGITDIVSKTTGCKKTREDKSMTNNQFEIDKDEMVTTA